MNKQVCVSTLLLINHSLILVDQYIAVVSRVSIVIPHLPKLQKKTMNNRFFFSLFVCAYVETVRYNQEVH